MLEIARVEKSYAGPTPALRQIDLTIARGEVLCLLGPSGCGKTTLLRIVAGLEQPDRGALTLDGRDLTKVPVHQRNFGLMFQDYALFPHRTVAQNVAFGLRMAGQSRTQIAQRVAEVLRLVSLQGYGDRSVFALSGGERQRVALARSLAPSPALLMLDEPLGSLDRTLRDELMTELRTILKRVAATALYVTHDQQEAFTVADRLVVMRAGRIAQSGTPQTVYHAPANAFVARFLGLRNLAPATWAADRQLAESAFGVWPVAKPSVPITEPLLLLIRPDAVQQLAVKGAHRLAMEVTLTGRLAALAFQGATYRLDLLTQAGEDEVRLRFDLPAALVNPWLEQLQLDVPVTLGLDPAGLTLIPAAEE